MILVLIISAAYSLALIIFIVLFFIKIWGYVYPYLFWGAIDVPSTPEKIDKMLIILEIKPGQMVVDLGAGDGRLLVALARAGVVACGYEINPVLVTRARKNIQEAGLEEKAFIFRKNLWKADLKNADAVVVYGMRHMMGKLEKKLDRELKPGARVASNYFKFPKWKPEKFEDGISLYIKK